MSKSYQFFSFIEYNNALKELDRLREENADENSISEANNKVVKLIFLTKKKYGFSYNQFKLWVKANQQFLNIITKQERLALKKAKDEAETIELLRSMDYTEIIEDYFEDFDETFLEN